MKKTSRKGGKHVNILGININSTTTSEVLANVEDNLSHNIKFYITTPNPEHVLASISNVKAKEALNDASMSVPDGVGLRYSSLFLYGKNLNVIHGRKLFVDLVNLSNKNRWKIFLLSGLDNEAKIVSSKLKKKYKRIKIETASGPVLTTNADPATPADKKLEDAAIGRINRFQPQLLFVAFGNPKQEIWVHRNLSRLNIGGAMVVGGTFRYIAGLSPLPPKWMEKLELEWLYRLISEPHRLRRIVNAVILFPLRVFWFKVTGN